MLNNVGLITCEMVVLGKGAMVLIGGSLERENSSVESILSFGGVCKFTKNFRNWRKKIRGGK